MAKSVRYYAEFKSREDDLYRIEILQDGSYAAQEVVLAANPVTIDWGNVDKLEPVMSSSATLRLVSMTDRQFVDMYTVEATSIRLNIYRDGSLYWSGTLDTELFEEPYSMLDRYVTELTFSDFAPLSRLKWQMTGFATMREVVTECLSISGIEYSSIEEHISTKIEGSVAELLDDAVLSMDNFYDEDGEAWSVREVLDETLRPFALRLKQKCGKIIIADINALAALTPQDVEWRGNNSTLGVEPTYNRAIINFSPYSETILFDGSFDHDETLKNNGDIYRGTPIDVPGTTFTGFTIYSGKEITEPTEEQGLILSNGVRVFRMDAEEDGEDTAGVLWGYTPYENRNDWVGYKPTTITTNREIMQTPPVTLVSAENWSYAYNLSVSLEVLYDVRKNPYEDASGYNESGNWTNFNNWANYGWILSQLVLTGDDGKTYSFDNSETFTDKPDANFAGGDWIEGSNGRLYLQFYNPSNYKSQTGFGGWQSNKRSVGYKFGTLPANFSKYINQEKIPMPPVGGIISLKIFQGVMSYDNSDDVSPKTDNVNNISRWLAYRGLKLSIVKASGKEIDAEDVVVSAWLNKAAENEISLDTYIGSMHSRVPMAKGVVLQQSNSNLPVKKFTRADITDTLENLLLGTLYSNYAGRKNTLEGTIQLVPTEQILSDKSSVNSRYLLLSERQDLQECFSEIKMAEIVEDSYTGIEYGADI